MRFAGFTIKNYKGIKELKLDLDKHPKSKVFTLVGLNESGKTSILEAISLFQQDVPEVERHTLIPKGEKISFNGSISITAALKLSEQDNEIISDLAKKLGYKEIEKYEIITIKKEYVFINSQYVEKKNIWDYTPEVTKKKGKKPFYIDHENPNWVIIADFIKNNMIPTIVYYPNFLFDFPEKIYIDDNADLSTEESTYKKIVQDILSSIRKDLNIKEQLIDRMQNKDKSHREALENTLSRMSSIVTQTVFMSWEKIFSGGKKAIEITSSSETEILKTATLSNPYSPNQEITRYYLEFKVREGINKFYIHERSLGFRWFFSFLLFTEFRKNRFSDSGEILFLLDEPASNLHSTAQKKLLDTFESLVNVSTLIYTTHSHHLINPEWLAGAFIVRNKALENIDEFDYNVNLTDIEATLYRQFVASNPKQKDYFQPILDTLDYQPGLLEKIPNIITTEGKFDFYTFRYLNLVYFSDKYGDLNFYPSTGADTNVPIIALYIAWNRPIIILLDGDEKGRKAKEKYENKFGLLVNHSIYTLFDIDSIFTGKSLEGLFSEEDKLKIIKAFDPNAEIYDKSKFNTAIQNLLFEKRKLDLSMITLDNFQKAFEFLMQKLIRK